MGKKVFDIETVSISRSRFDLSHKHLTSINHGDLVPIDVVEVLPGDTHKVKLSSLIRMTTPIAPIMDDIAMYAYAFFVPTRLVWEHTKQFYGENTDGFGIPDTEFSIPQMRTSRNHSAENVGSLNDYFGVLTSNSDTGVFTNVSALIPRGYCLIWNEWFRDENLMAPVIVNTGDTGDIGTYKGEPFWPSSKPLKVCKRFDRFTSALPWPQKGESVLLPLGDKAVVTTGADHVDNLGGHSLHLKHVNDNNMPSGLLASVSTGQGNFTGKLVDHSGGAIDEGQVDTVPSNLWADLSTATAASINQIRYAFQLQKFLEKNARGGSRFWEFLNVHFGVTSPDARIQRPEYLGGIKVNINIDQVLQTTGYETGDQSKLAAPGANSVTGDSQYLFTKSFVEPGYIYILCSFKHQRTYGQGLHKMWSRKRLLDFYLPVFANIGEQPIFAKEIYFKGDSRDDVVFGYQEAWSEYRYLPNRVSGLMNPANPGSLNYWDLADNFSAAPVLNEDFIIENRDNLQRALTSSETDYICDFWFDWDAVRPMPVYSIPGLIDHH